MKTKGVSIAAVALLFLLGFCVLLYPFVSNWLAGRQHLREITVYEEDVSVLAPDYVDAEWQKAVDYNNGLAGDPVKDPFIPGTGRSLPQNYLDVLNVEGVMCVVEIPKINVKLPVYHGTSDEVLEKGVGHMEGTALPIGSMGGHTLLTGHTGLPTARLFTDLPKLALGDKFFVHVLGKELVYEVNKIDIIEPDDISQLASYSDKDYVTLITCTPYGINSHRLLVRGERVYQMEKGIGLRGNGSLRYKIALALALLLLLILLLALLWRAWRKHRRNRKAKQEEAKRKHGLPTPARPGPHIEGKGGT